MLTLWQIFIIVMLIILLVLSAILIAINSKNISNIGGGDGSGIGQRPSLRDIGGEEYPIFNDEGGILYNPEHIDEADHGLDDQRLADEQFITDRINIQFANNAAITINNIEEDINIIHDINLFMNNYYEYYRHLHEHDYNFLEDPINGLIRDIPNIITVMDLNGIVPGGIVYNFHVRTLNMYHIFLDFIHGRDGYDSNGYDSNGYDSEWDEGPGE